MAASTSWSRASRPGPARGRTCSCQGAPCTPTRTPATGRAGCSWSTRRAGRRSVSWRLPANRRPDRGITRAETTGDSPSSRPSTASRYAKQERRRKGASEMIREKVVRYGGPAAILGGVMHVLAFVAVYMIYFAFAEEAKGTFFGQHAFIHIIDVAMFALLAVGSVGVYLSQSGLLGRIARAGFFLTLGGFGLSVIGGLTIIVVGLAVSDEATLGVLDVVTHPLAQLLYTLGSAIFGVALFRKGTLPKIGALLVAAGPIALFALFMSGNQQAIVPIMASVVATGLGWAILGYAIRGTERSKRTSISLRPTNPAA